LCGTDDRSAGGENLESNGNPLLLALRMYIFREMLHFHKAIHKFPSQRKG
jgi:hypothetical protein